MSETFVETFTHLKGRPKSDQALPLLQRIASLVKPIMRKHNWKLPVLSEFFPDNPSLLGMNVGGGSKILIRLRPPYSPDTFYDEEDLVGTMLHELTHNVHGPHDAKFYKLLGELEDEYDKLKESGYSGEGFHSVGRKVGVGVSHNLPPHLARLKALEAAERRQKVQTVMGGSGRKLGGRPLGNAKELSPRELAAQAAERRARDDKTCGFSHGEEVQREATRAAKDSIEDKTIEFIDLTDDDDPEISKSNEDTASEMHLISKRNESNRDFGISSSDGIIGQQPVPTSSTSAYTPSIDIPGTSKRRLEPPLPKESVKRPRQEPFWSCSRCTLHNDLSAEACVLCSAARPRDVWVCLVCAEKDIPHSIWSCPFCGTVKSSS